MMTQVTGTIAKNQLRAFIERIERLEDEKLDLMADIREVYAEAKGMGYDTKIMRQVVSIRKKDFEKRREEEFVLETYLSALDMLDKSGGATGEIRKTVNLIE